MGAGLALRAGLRVRMGSPAGTLPRLLLLLLLPRLLSAQSGTLPIPAPSSTPAVPELGSLLPDNSSSSPQPSTVAGVEEEDDWSAPESYLYSGDASVLASASCRRGYSLPTLSGDLPPDLLPLLRPAIAALTNAANFLNLIFQASELREMSVREDLEWYYALVRAMLEADRPGLVRRALLTFDADPTAPQPHLVLRASRTFSQDILLQDLTSAWESLHPPGPDLRWFSSLKFSTAPMPALSKRVLLNDLSTLDTPKWARGDSFVTNSSGVRWSDSPYLECEEGRFPPGWLLTLSMPFYGLKPDLSPEFRGVIRVDVSIQGLDIDQCSTSNVWFGDTHECNRTSMVCEPIPRKGFRLGQYCCRCKEGFYSLTSDDQEKQRGSSNTSQACYPQLPVCLPCWPGCERCEDGSPCWVQEDWLLRGGVLAMQGFFMGLVLVSMLVAYQFRRTKRIRASGLFLLEIILFGSLLLYFPVFILYFKPSTFRCILLRWVRLLGFAIVYGTVTLKLYRVLKVFLSRTAQRVPYMSSNSLLRILGVMVLAVSWFLSAWTVAVLQNRDRNIPLLIISSTSDGQGFNLCDLDRWDYMMAVAELLFLCWGSSLSSAVKTVPSAFHEPRYMRIAIHNELLLSSMFHFLRFVRPSLHPDWMLLLFFSHTHVTTTVTLGLLFVPKLLHMSRPGREEIAAEVYEDEVDLRRSCSFLNSSFTSTWNDHTLDPDDIRDELKKLYAQLEVNKSKRMTTNNPHVQKKRSSRAGLGLSIIKRIAEIPGSLSRQCSRESRDSRNIYAAAGGKSGSYERVSGSICSMIIKNEMMAQSSPMPQKSPSAYSYKERKSSLLNSSIRNTPDKRVSYLSDTESIDTAPIVSKSASAHNLSVDTCLLQPEQYRFQKSLSVIERHKEHYLLSPSKSMEGASFASRTSSTSSREALRKKQDATIQGQTTSALLCESFDKCEVCPWEVEESTDSKSQKHVSYSLAQQEEPKSPSMLFVCPWDNLPPPSPSPTEGGDGPGSDAESLRLTISSSAPVSPSPKPNELRVFTFRSATQGLLAAKGLASPGRSSNKDKSKNSVSGKDKKEETIHQQSQAKGVVSAKSMSLTPTYSARNHGKKTPQLHKRSMTTVQTKHSLVKQTAIRLPSTDSQDKSPRKGSLQAKMEDRRLSLYENVFSRQNSSTMDRERTSVTAVHTEVCPWDSLPDSKQMPPTQLTSLANVCPWEMEESEEAQTKGTLADVCGTTINQRAEKYDISSVCPWESQVEASQKQESVKAEVCPWEEADTTDTQIKQDLVKCSTEGIKQTERMISVGARESDQTVKRPKQQETIQVSVCPWDLEETAKDQKNVCVDVCPWELEETSSPPQREPSKSMQMVKQTTATSHLLTTQVTNTAETCPWDFPEPSPPDSGIYALDAENAETSKTKQANMRQVTKESTTKRADACPWETDEPENINGIDNTQGSLCQGSSVKSIQTQETAQNVCSRDTKTPERCQRQDCIKSNLCPPETNEQRVCADVCPWESIEPGMSERQDSVGTDVCPTQPEKLNREQESVKADICPWETDTPKTTQEQESVCPWDTTESCLSKGQDSVRANICPWETEQPEQSTQKQDNARAGICPWEMDEPIKSTHAQESILADVCPWQTEQPEISTQTQESVHTDICPWETDEPKYSTHRQHTSQVDTHPLQIGQQQQLSGRPDTTYGDVCPWESGEPNSSKGQDGAIADICPWECDSEIPTETAAGTRGSSGDFGLAQKTEFVYPAEHSEEKAEEPRVNLPLARQDALCPWEMSKSQSITELDNPSDVFTWEEPIPEEEDDDAESAAEAFIFPPDL